MTFPVDFVRYGPHGRLAWALGHIMLGSRSTTRIAIWAFVAPGVVALMSGALMSLIPGCNPNPYSVKGCVVLSHDLAAPLMACFIGGIILAVLWFVLVSFPLSVIAFFFGSNKLRSPRGRDVA